MKQINALSHNTGGGIPGNLSRSLPRGLGAVVERMSWSVPPLFRFLQKAGKVKEGEMYRVFNMGVGMIAAVPPESVASVRDAARKAGVETWVVGEIVAGGGVTIQ